MSEIVSIPASVAAGLVRARRAVRAVEKDSKNEHHGYKYASAEDMMAEGLRALNEAGLAFSCVSWVVVQIERPRSIATESGAVETVVESVPRLRCVFLLIAEDGACASSTTDNAVVPGKGRPEDKAEFGMLTEAYAYALRGWLGIPREDERISVSGRDDSGAEPDRAAPRRGPPTPRPLAPQAANDAPPPESRGPAAWPPRGSVSGERGDEEQRLSGIIAAADTPAAAEVAWGACKGALDAGAIGRDVARRLHESYKLRRDALASQGAAQ